MPRIAYVNGRYVPWANARVHVEDRGFQFADGVYEVTAILNRRLLFEHQHLARLKRSREAIGIAVPMSDAALGLIGRRLIAANRIEDGTLYLQLTRGTARRDHAFPRSAKPTLVMVARPFDFASRHAAVGNGAAVVTLADERWRRASIKSVSLLPNVLAKEAARRAGAYEAWFTGPDDAITEGSSTNAWMVEHGRLVTAPLSPAILAGVTRATLIELAREAGLPVEERAFTPAQAQAANEAFLTSTTNPVLPVVRIDGAPVGDGRPGPLTQRVAGLMWDRIARETGWRPLSVAGGWSG